VVLFVEPESREGKALTEQYLRHGIASVDEGPVRDAAAAPFATWLARAGDEAVIAGARRVILALTRGREPVAPTDERILRAVAYINAHLNGPIRLTDVARDIHLSPGRLRHLFVEETGMGLRPYVLWRRFLRAWDVLVTGESLSTAAHRAGFADSAHFTRTSRQAFGFPPSFLQVGMGPVAE
jgi:AraC-like DNA-binding protein